MKPGTPLSAANAKRTQSTDPVGGEGSPTSADKRLIHVVAAVIHHPDQQQILLAKRPDHLHQGGLWEFPGGKVDGDEQPRRALDRELAEELAITVISAEPFLEVRHDYDDRAVLLDVWQVWRFDGTPLGNEGQQVRWVPRRELANYPFPAANLPIIEALLTGA